MTGDVQQFYGDFPIALFRHSTRRVQHDVKTCATAELGNKLPALQSRSKCSVG
jgi:hypothetical protein